MLCDSTDPAEAFALIEQERVTHTALVPALAMRWMEAPERERFDLSSLRVLQVGGAKLNPEPARRIRPTLGCQLQQVFGMAEGLLNYTRLDDPDQEIVETQGRPCSPDDEIRIVDDEGRDVPPASPASCSPADRTPSAAITTCPSTTRARSRQMASTGAATSCG